LDTKPEPKETQNYNLLKAMESGEPVTKEELAKVLGVEEQSVAVYIFELRNRYRAKIESVREGRKVTAYKLLNVQSVRSRVSKYRTNNARYYEPERQKAKRLAREHAVAEGILVHDPDSNILNYGEREMADIRDNLGFGNMGWANL